MGVELSAPESVAVPLEHAAPVALLRFVPGADGFDLVEANTLAGQLLGAAADELRGAGFAAGLFDADGETLASSLAGAAGPPSQPVVIRWGSAPPVTFLCLRAQLRPDGSVAVALQDVTDQYRLDVFACGQGAGVFLTGTDSRITWMSPLSEVTLGLSPSVMIGRHNTASVHPDDVDAITRDTAEILAHPGVEFVRSYRVAHPSAPDTYWLMRFVSQYLPDEPAVGAIINRSELVLDPEGVEDSSHMTMAEVMPSGLVMATDDRVLFRNSMACRLLGSTIEHDDPLGWVAGLRSAHRQLVGDAVAGAAAGSRETVIVAVDRAEQIVGYLATFLDVTAEVEAREELQRSREDLWAQANHDSLTGLANRMQFGDRLEQALARKRRDGHAVAVLFCDLDLFKRVNDEQGHHAGDAVLVEVAHRLRGVTRETDTVCRIGGDEFVVICESFDDASGVEHLAQRLVDTVARPIDRPEVRACIQLSIGVAIATATCSVDQLVSRADQALYAAKEAGRGRFVVAG